MSLCSLLRPAALGPPGCCCRAVGIALCAEGAGGSGKHPPGQNALPWTSCFLPALALALQPAGLCFKDFVASISYRATARQRVLGWGEASSYLCVTFGS